MLFEKICEDASTKNKKFIAAQKVAVAAVAMWRVASGGRLFPITTTSISNLTTILHSHKMLGPIQLLLGW